MAGSADGLQVKASKRGRRPRRATKGGAAALVVVAAGVVLARLPLASAAFTATTANAVNAFAAANSFCTSPGSATLTVANDSMVVQSTPTTSYGQAVPITVRSLAGDNRRLLIRPALTAIPAGCTLTSAVLKLTVTAFRGGRTYQAYALASDWGINTANWNNQPAVVGAPATATTSNTTWSIDVVGPMSTLYANGAGGNYGLLIKDSAEDSSTERTNSYDSLNGSSPGQITYTWG